MKYLSLLCLVLLSAYAFADDEDMETDETSHDDDKHDAEFGSFFTYYRKAQQRKGWEITIKQLKTDHTKISVEKRVELITNAFIEAKNGDLGYETVFELTEYLVNERDYLPWYAAIESFSNIKTMMTSTAKFGLFQQHMEKITVPVLTDVGFTKILNEVEEHAQLRSLIMSSACSFKNEECISHSMNVFKQWTENHNQFEIPVELKGTVMCTAIREGGLKEWNIVYKFYKESKSKDEKAVYLNAMACSREPWVLSRMLEWSIDTNSEMSTKEASMIIHHVAGNTIGRCMTFNFVRNHWDEITARFSKSASSMKRIIESVSSTITSAVELEEFESFIGHHSESLTKVTKVVKESVSQTKKNCEWKEETYPKVSHWLERNYSYDN